MKIKICGLYRDEDITFANQVIPDYVGFVFAPSHRQVTLQEAILFRNKLSPAIKAVGVFVNEANEVVERYLSENVIDIAQLHGEETEEDIRQIKKLTGKPVIKAVKPKNIEDVKAWLDSEADYLLFDSGMGSGLTFDWNLLKEVNRPFFLAGGLKPENMREAIELANPYGLDVSSGVETNQIKDLAKMRSAVEIVRSYRK